MRLTRKIEIQPTPAQRKTLMQSVGTSRWVYNWGLAECLEAYKLWISLDKPSKWKGWQNSFSLSKEITRIKRLPTEDGGASWLREVSSTIPQQALRDLDTAFKGFLKGKSKYPKFKKKGVRDSFRVVQGIKVEEKSITLPKLGRIRIKPGQHGYVEPCKPSQVTVSCKAGRWYVSVLLPNEIEEPEPSGLSSVGIDLGVSRLATLSDGRVFENPRHLKNHQKKLKRLQRELSRKKKGSANRRKARAKVTQRIKKRLDKDFSHDMYAHAVEKVLSQMQEIN